MKKKRKVAKAELARFHEFLSYDPETGIFLWKKKSNRNIVVGTEAGVIYPSGYKGINLNKKQYPAHRVAWAMMTGEWPGILDHVNRIKGDNRWANLREADFSTNGANAGLKKANVSGFKGVSWHKRMRGFRAQVRKDYKPITIGFFKTAREAAMAYDRTAISVFGEFARTNAMMGLL